MAGKNLKMKVEDVQVDEEKGVAPAAPGHKSYRIVADWGGSATRTSASKVGLRAAA